MRLPTLKPRPLKRGDKIGVLSPAGCVGEEKLQAGVAALRQAGYEVELARGVLERKGYLAGEAGARARALEGFFTRRDIAGVFCARGGFGSIQLLPLLHTDIFQKHPKLFVGYSDVSVILNWMVQRCGLVSFHGPMVAMEIARGLGAKTAPFFWDVLSGLKKTWRVEGAEPIREGSARAEMIGGCLSALVTTLGTPFEIQTEGKILLLEDIGEKPYRIERMLTHLQMAGKLSRLAGLVFGNFTDCEGEGDRGVMEIVTELFREAPYPVITGFPAGHGEENLLIPFGVAMELKAEEGTLSLVEAPTASRRGARRTEF